MEGISSYSGQTTSETDSLPKHAASAERGLRQGQHKSWRTVGRQQSLREEYLLEEYMLALLSLCKKFAHDHY